MHRAFIAALLAALAPAALAVLSQTYTYKNVKIGGGGGFVPGIVFNPGEKGITYARTDIGGAYKLNSDDTWTPLLDFADSATWNYQYVDALATDPIDTKRVYLAVGAYTNSWDPNNGSILRSSDYGKTWAATKLSFKVGGNMPGRGMGERLAVDPNLNSILFFGARSGKGLWKSTDYGVTWTQVTNFPSTGTYIQDPADTTGYTSDIQGISWVTFDSTSGTKGTATPRIFVGVANLNANSVFVSTNGGSTWSAVAGQPGVYIPHKGVLSPSEKSLYITFNNHGGPYDGDKGTVHRYNISTGVWTDISPPNPSGFVYGFGGLSVDRQKPGTLVVAALNQWWPDVQIWRSTNSGSTWSILWEFTSYPTMAKYFTYDVSLAPWLGVVPSTETKQLGWMVESIEIDPFDSNHYLYGTGATIYGGRDLTNWDSVHKITVKSLADGIEETAVLGLISPSSGPNLLSVVGDIGGFVHNDFTKSPPTGAFQNPAWGTTTDIDWAGNKPTNIVRVGNSGNSTKQVALSSDSGATWSQDYGAADNVAGGKVAFSADADTVLWSTGTNGVQVSRYTASFTAVSSLPSGAVIASDKKNNAVFYAASGSRFYISTNNGVSFTATATLGSSQWPVKIAANILTSGDVWVTSDVGLFHSTNSGTSFSTIAGFTQAWGVALGAPKTTGGYPAVFVAATYTGVTGYFRSDDAGVNWIQIDDAAHRFGSPGANVLAADPRVYGRVYIGTNGRGIFYGDASGTPPTGTATASSTPSSSAAASSSVAASSSSSRASSGTVTSSSAAPTTAPAYGQCGGQNWTGPTACPTGWVCTYSNPFYSQCLPA